MNDIVAYVMLMGALSGGSNLPFWTTANQYGIYPDSNGGIAQLYVGQPFDESKDFHYRWGASLVARGDRYLGGQPWYKTFLVDELYASVGWKCLTLDIGTRHRPKDFLGPCESLGSLSTTSGHLTWTGNARSMPGYNLILEKVAVYGTKKHLWFWGNFSDYVTTDENYSRRALVHSTSLFFKVYFDPGLHFAFTAGLDHYAVWGGEKYASSVNFKNYLRVITGSSAGKDGTKSDQMNVIGDQGGSELLRFDYEGEKWNITFQHEIPYADKSGMLFHNFPDGVNTFCFSFKDRNKWVTDIVYEFYYTMYQSGSQHDAETYPSGEPRPWQPGLNYIGLDNYYNNGEFRSGWSHYGRLISGPLFFSNGTRDGIINRYAEVSSLTTRAQGTENNRIIAHHIGLGGKLFKKAPYRLMLTFSQNYGTYSYPYVGESPAGKPWGTFKDTPLLQFSAGLTGEVPGTLFNVKWLDITYGIYGDVGEVLEKQFGATLGLRFNLL